MEQGTRTRTTAATHMNANSSRSHMLINLQLKQVVSLSSFLFACTGQSPVHLACFCVRSSLKKASQSSPTLTWWTWQAVSASGRLALRLTDSKKAQPSTWAWPLWAMSSGLPFTCKLDLIVFSQPAFRLLDMARFGPLGFEEKETERPERTSDLITIK